MTKLSDFVTVVVPEAQLVFKGTFSHLFNGVL